MDRETETSRNWHAFTTREALDMLESRQDGLGEGEVTTRRAIFGPNQLPRPRPAGAVVIYLRQFRSPLIYLLLAAAAVSVVIGEFSDAGFIFAVLQINAIIGTVQEWKADRSVLSLSNLIESPAMVCRNGERQQVPSEDLVPGDIIFLESGALVPADARLIRCRDVKIDESLLTGESLPVGKDPDAVLADQTPLGDRANMIHAGSTVLNGRIKALVAHTGLNTQIGRIAQALSLEATAPPLVVRLKYFTRMIAMLFCVVITALAVTEFMRGTELAEIFFISIALAVSAIPEGLPVAITVALAVGTNRMARRHVVVRLLPAVEGLGACTLIASDKTGTLTCNELTIKRVMVPEGGDYRVSGEGYEPVGEVIHADGRPLGTEDIQSLRGLAAAGALCTEATLRVTPEGVSHFGDTVDVSILVLATKLGLRRAELQRMSPETGFIPFESQSRYAASFNRHGADTEVHVKGAAEAVLAMCEGDVDAFRRQADALANEGYRVLAVASGPVTAAEAAAASREALHGLAFQGLVGIIDPVRPEVPEAVRQCRAAGVAVHMVTGDHPGTALAIARELGIAEREEDVVEGTELTELVNDPARLQALCQRCRVFARVDPMQKLVIVEALQKAGHFVAVTGDGANDAPALRIANIGVAMGKKGTDVARSAADLILADDNFASIVSGIIEGRVAYDNIRKVIYLLISTGGAEIVLFFLAMAWGMPLPLFAVQLLWLNLITNGIQDVALAFEKAEPNIIDRQPRPPDQPIFDRVMINQTVISGAFMGITAFGYYQWILGQGMSETEARNILLLLMVLFENVHVFNCRSELRSAFRVPVASNWFVVFAVIAAQAVHIGAMYMPGFSDVLHLQPVSFTTWLEVAALSLTLLVVMEIYKLIATSPHFHSSA